MGGALTAKCDVKAKVEGGGGWQSDMAIISAAWRFCFCSVWIFVNVCEYIRVYICVVAVIGVVHLCCKCFHRSIARFICICIWNPAWCCSTICMWNPASPRSNSMSIEQIMKKYKGGALTQKMRCECKCDGRGWVTIRHGNHNCCFCLFPSHVTFSIFLSPLRHWYWVFTFLLLFSYLVCIGVATAFTGASQHV